MRNNCLCVKCNSSIKALRWIERSRGLFIGKFCMEVVTIPWTTDRLPKCGEHASVGFPEIGTAGREANSPQIGNRIPHVEFPNREMDEAGIGSDTNSWFRSLRRPLNMDVVNAREAMRSVR